MTFIDRVRGLLAPEPERDLEWWWGWGEFPPLSEETSESEIESYLDRCSFGGAVLGVDSQLTVRILDPDRLMWTFRFPRAAFSVPRWPDNTVSEDWETGIMYMATSISRNRWGRTTCAYELESRVSLDIECDADAVQVIPPTGSRPDDRA